MKNNNINMNYLQYFYVVTESESITKAAAQLFITQPALSNAISKLEADLGVKLFDRIGNNKIRLNNQGWILKRHLQLAFREIGDAISELNDQNDEFAGEVHFAAPSGGITDLAIRSFRNMYPNIKLYQYFMSAGHMSQGLQDGTLDFAISYIPLDNIALDWVPSIKVRIMALVSQNHPMADRDEISIRDLRNDRFAFNSFNSEFPNICCDCCRKAGFEPQVIYQSGTPEIVSEIIRNGDAVTLIPTLGYEYFMQDHVSVGFLKNNIIPLKLSDSFCEMSVGIVTLKDHYISRGAENFISFLKENFPQ